MTVVGRKKEIIIRGGLNITPREIEEMLTLFPEVERAAVVGLPDERLGERMCACVVLHPVRKPRPGSPRLPASRNKALPPTSFPNAWR